MTTFEEHDGRYRVVVERHLPHPIEKVWRAVTEPAHLSQWFPAPMELELRPGGAMRFPGFEVDKPRRLALALAPGIPGDHLVLELGEGTGHGARAVLTVTGAEQGERTSAEDEWGPSGALGGLAEAGLAWATSDRPA